MTLDGMSSIEITDGYRMQRSVNPAPGEQFVVQWRLRRKRSRQSERPL